MNEHIMQIILLNRRYGCIPNKKMQEMVSIQILIGIVTMDNKKML